MHVQYRLVIVEIFWKLRVPTFVIIGWSIRQACGLLVYPHRSFGHMLESGEWEGPSYSRVMIAGAHSSITILEVNNGLGSNTKPLSIVSYA